jgi:hypothetical protein
MMLSGVESIVGDRPIGGHFELGEIDGPQSRFSVAVSTEWHSTLNLALSILVVAFATGA